MSGLVELGFAEEVDDESIPTLHDDPDWSNWDGGKIGGAPSWLSPRGLPPSDALKCASCGAQESFLMQVYAPVDFDDGRAFHRSIYVFCCSDARCGPAPSSQDGSAGRGVHVFRCQLPRKNPFYAFESEDGAAGGTGSSSASIFKGAGGASEAAVTPALGAPFKEFDLVVESEPSGEGDDGDGSDGSDGGDGGDGGGGGGGEGGEGPGGAAAAASAAPSEERIRTMLEKAGIQNVDPSALTTDDGFGDSGPSQATLNAMLRGEEVPAGVASTGGEEEEDDEDEAGISDERTLSFMQRVAAEPAQCLRYGRWGENETRPLWVASETIPVDVPACEHCGAPRDFEMQVMPQVLHFVGNGHGPDVGSTGLDFGTIAIYSCTNSCQGSSDYAAEYAWVQPHSEQTMIAATDTQKQQLASIAKPIEAAAATGGAGAGRGRTVIEEEDEEEEELD